MIFSYMPFWQYTKILRVFDKYNDISVSVIFDEIVIYKFLHLSVIFALFCSKNQFCYFSFISFIKGRIELSPMERAHTRSCFKC